MSVHNLFYMRLIGIDPGFGKIGIGVIEGTHGSFKAIAYGCIETSPHEPFVSRLHYLKKELQNILTVHTPTVAGVEQLFFHTNTTTAMRVSEARGVILLTLFEAGVSVIEVTPLQMKQAIVGYGRAEKRQVEEMVRRELGIEEPIRPDDAADALAIAITAATIAPHLDKDRGP